jgi:hypothetical protein
MLMHDAIGQWRERISLTSTVKEGFRVGDATVEFTETATLGGDPPREERRARLKALIEDGERVAAQLNHDRNDANKYSK